MILSFPLVFIVLLQNTFSFNIQNEIFRSCLKSYNPSFAFIFSCQKSSDNIYLYKHILHDKLIKTRIAVLQPKNGILQNKINTSNYESVHFLLDIDCEGAALILNGSTTPHKTAKFSRSHNWFLLTNSNNTIFEFKKKLSGLNLRADSNVKLFHPYENNTYRILDIFNPGLNIGITIKEAGYFKDGKLSLFHKMSYYESRKNLNGVLIRAATVVKYPFKTNLHEYMIDLKYRYHDIYSKFHYQLMLVLQDIHKFSFNITRRSAWFGNRSSGEDGGIAKMLWDGTADISCSGGMIRLLGPERVYFYDYIMPFYKYQSYFFFRNPGRVKPNFYEVLKPFTKSTWTVTIYMVLIVCTCIEIVSLIEQRNNGERWRLNSLFIIVAAFSQQGLYRLPQHLASRIILLHVFILSILLYNYYTSSLVSSLISTEPEMLKTIEELIQSDLKVGIDLQPFTITYILDRKKTDKALNKLNESKVYANIKKPNFWSVDEGVDKIRTGGYAYLTEAIEAYPRIAKTFEQESICNLVAIPLLDSVTSLMTQKKGPYKKLFQVSLRKMWERGIMDKLQKLWLESKPECLSSIRVISVGVNDLFLIYFLLVIGIIISLLILLTEFLWMKIQKWMVNRSRKVWEFTN